MGVQPLCCLWEEEGVNGRWREGIRTVQREGNLENHSFSALTSPFVPHSAEFPPSLSPYPTHLHTPNTTTTTTISSSSAICIQ